MATADRNESASTGATGTGNSATTTTTAATGAGSAGSASVPSAARPTTSTQKKERSYFVDGQAVSEKEWLEAAAANGYDLSRLPDNYRPAINTKNHGQK